MTKFVLGPTTPAEPAAGPDAGPIGADLEGTDFMDLLDADWDHASDAPMVAPKPDVDLYEVARGMDLHDDGESPA